MSEELNPAQTFTEIFESAEKTVEYWKEMYSLAHENEQQQAARIAELERKFSTETKRLEFAEKCLTKQAEAHAAEVATMQEMIYNRSEEIERLNAQIALDSGNIERMQQAGAAAEVEIERLNAEIRDRDNTIWQTVAELDRWKSLAEYARHMPECEWISSNECQCGLQQIESAE